MGGAGKPPLTRHHQTVQPVLAGPFFPGSGRQWLVVFSTSHAVVSSVATVARPRSPV